MPWKDSGLGQWEKLKFSSLIGSALKFFDSVLHALIHPWLNITGMSDKVSQVPRRDLY